MTQREGLFIISAVVYLPASASMRRREAMARPSLCAESAVQVSLAGR